MASLTRADEYIIFDSGMRVVGERDLMQKVFKVFPALRNRNYRLYFSGQLISLTGTWLQTVSQGWLVLQLTNSALLIGLVAAVASLPTLLFSVFAGVIVDRFPKRKILVGTQICAMILAFVLGLLTVFEVITIWQIMVLAFLLGVVTAIDLPARQAFTIEMVGKEDLASAISLNAAIFNGARVIGPGIAGLLIALTGVGFAFLINGVSYIAVVAALVVMRVAAVTHRTHSHPLIAVKEGIVYSIRHPVVRILLLFTCVTSIFGWPYTTILPYIAQHTFHLEAAGLGYLYAASGLGALCATLVVALFSKKVPAIVFILGGSVIFAIGLFLFSFTTNLSSGLVFLFLAGFGLLLQFSMMNTTIQTQIEDRYRGRVMSLYILMFLGMAPFGNFQIGYFSELFGPEFAIRFGAFIILLCGLFVSLNRRKISMVL